MGKAKELAELANNLTVSGGAVTVSGFNYDNIVASAPGALDTLNELAAAIGDDANFSTTVTNSIATKLPLAGGTLTGNIAHASDLTIDVGGDITFDADGGDIILKDGGAEYGKLSQVLGGLTIKSGASSTPAFVLDGSGNVIGGGNYTTNGRIGIGTDTPAVALDVVGDLRVANSADAMLSISDVIGEVGSGNLAFQVQNTAGSALKPMGFRAEDIRFATGSAERFRITSTGYLDATGASQIRLTLGSEGTAGTNTANWIRGNGTTLGFNSASGGFHFEIGGNEKLKIDSTGQVGIGTNSPTVGLDMYGAGNMSRIKLRNSSGHQINFGLWDGTNYRMEGDANRPILITSYNGNGVQIGGSGANNMQVSTGGVDFMPNSGGSFNFKGGGGNQLSIKTAQYTAGSGTSIGTSNIQVVNSAFGALVFVAGYGNGQFCDLVYFGYNASPTILAQQTIAGSPPSRIYTGSGYALYMRYSSGSLTTKVNCIQSHS